MVDFGDGNFKPHTIDPTAWAGQRQISGTVLGPTLRIKGNLTELEVRESSLTGITIDGCQNLTRLDLSKNLLTDFAITGLTPLEYLNLDDNRITNSVSENSTLTLENCGATLTNLRISNNPGLRCLDIRYLTVLEYLSANNNDKKEVQERLDWIAFKNQFFSSVFLADADFEKTKLSSKMETQGSGYIKDYSAEMSTKFDPTGKEPTRLFFYFGPNHYKTLTALDKGRDEKWELNRLVYLGWPLIRWINKWFTINIFDWLSSWGLSMGIVLLILTIMVKVVVYPATWKTYMSSAKMRVLNRKSTR